MVKCSENVKPAVLSDFLLAQIIPEEIKSVNHPHMIPTNDFNPISSGLLQAGHR